MRIQRRHFDNAFTLAILFLATGAFQSLLVDPANPQSATDGSSFLQILWFLGYLGVAIRLAPRYRDIILLVRDNKYLALLILLAISSTLWSEDPGLTLRRSAALFGSALIGIDFAVRHPVREQLRLLCIVLGVAVVLGIVAQVLFPTFIPSGDFDTQSWHGIAAFKNDWARIIVLATIAMLSRSRRCLRDFVLVAFLTATAFALIALARSVGALVLLIAMLLLIQVFGVLRWRPKTRSIVGLAGVLIVLPASYLTFRNFDKVTALLGRDVTLTGRVDLWRFSLSSIEKNPIHGYGFSAFWDAESQQALRIREEANWNAPHAHNGFIDMTLELGLAGLSLFMVSYLIAARRAIHCLQRGWEREAMWPLAYLMFFFLYQFTEGTLVAGNTLFWILYVAASFSVTRLTVPDRVALKYESDFTAPMQTLPLSPEEA